MIESFCDTCIISTVANTVMNGLGTEGKWYEFSFDYKNIDRHLVMGGIQTASSAAGSPVNDPASSKALSTFVQGSHIIKKEILIIIMLNIHL